MQNGLISFSLSPKQEQTNKCPGTKERRYDSASTHWRQLGSLIDWRFQIMEFDNQPKWLGRWETNGLSASWTRLIEQWSVGRWEFPLTPSTSTLNRPHPGLDKQLWAPTFNTLTRTKIPKKQDSPFEGQSWERENSLSPKGNRDLRELQGNRFHFCVKNKLSMGCCYIAQGA